MKIQSNCNCDRLHLHVIKPMSAPHPYMVKPFKYLLLWNQKANDLGTWYVCSIGDLGPTRFAPIISLG